MGRRLFRFKDLLTRHFSPLREAYDAWGWYPIPTSGPVNPYQAEGAKTIAYEISSQLKINPSDWVFYPICGGDNIVANWKGFRELEMLNMAGRPPKLVGVQASACGSLVEPLREGHERIRTIKNPRTVASSICIEYPPTGLSQGASRSESLMKRRWTPRVYHQRAFSLSPLPHPL